MAKSDLLSSPARDDPEADDTRLQRTVSYSTGEHMMARGAPALHEDIAGKVETALGKAFPQMEIRFDNLSLTADMVLAHDRHGAVNAPDDELPTLPNHVLQKIAHVSAMKHTVQKHILRNLSGVFKPGTVTLILGQSGSGKSALMKILSGRFPLDKRIELDGTISYNGMPRDAVLKRLPQFVAYVTQTDVHFPTLTVKETLEFAHACCGGAHLSQRAEELLTQGTPEENAEALKAAKNVIKKYPTVVTQALGLVDCANTVVGDAMLRGISGGERKRVTTGEMEFGMKYVTLMDEITTGLDSAAAYDIINTQRSIAKQLHKTVIISLLQPSPEVFALFDNVLLLNEGEVMYHGPCEQALPYFESLGFVCTPRRDVADFLCDLGTAQQLPYEAGRLPQHLKQFPRHASEFAELFRESAIYQATREELRAPVDPVLLMDVEKHINPMPEFYQSFTASTWTVTKRQMLLLWKNQTFLKGRALLVAIMGFLFSSLFYQMDFSNVQVVLGVMFASVLFLGLGQSSMLTTFYHARAVFYKQRAANFYRTSSYVLAASVSQVPLAIAESIIFGSLVYWFGGFVDRVGEFLLFELYLMLCILVFLSWFFFLSAIAPNLHVAKPLAMVSLLVFILFAGFVVSKDQIPGYMRWIYWIDPVAWVVRSLAVSQYRSAKYDVCYHDGVTYCTPAFGGKTMGEYYLGLFDVPAETSWAYTGLIFLGGAYLLFMVLAWLTLEYKRYEKPEHIALPKELLEQEARGSEPDSEDTTTADYQMIASPSSRQNAGQIVLQVDETLSSARAFQPVTIAFQDLWYSVPVPGETKGSTVNIDLLKGITGYALPGTITALMGSSGAGKTTLMDVIAGRKAGGNGTIKGKILLNGHEASDLAIRRSTGYCEQMDIHSEAATFREALTFSAFLRQSASVSDARKYDSVNECLDLLDMHDIADHIIRGSSMEQHKRLTIGVELAAQPSVLFLDEPTSGLDARSAKVIMDGVRKVADSGRTILCTIHQPSSEVFHLFDRLLLLKRGGETVYFGPLGFEGHDLIRYFEALPGVKPIPNGYNPATWMLEVIGAGVNGGEEALRDEAVDFVEAYNASETKTAVLDAVMSEAGLFVPSEAAPQVTFTSKRAATNAVQVRFLMQRFFRVYWRTPSYNWTRLVISLLLGLVFGLVYLDSEYTTYQGINGGLGMVFLATAFIGIVSFISILPIAFEERAAFYRERASQTYNAFWYFVCFTVVEIPYVCVGALLFTVTFYPMVGFTGFGTAVYYWLNTMLHILFQAYMGQFLIFAFPSIEVAAVIGVLFNAVFFMLMGFNPPALQIPAGYKWLYAITPHRYTFALLAGAVFGDCSEDHLAQMRQAAALHINATQVPDAWEMGCKLIQNAPPSVGDHVPIKVYIDHVFGIKHAHLGQYFGIFMGAIVLFRVLAACAMRYINHQKH